MYLCSVDTTMVIWLEERCNRQPISSVRLVNSDPEACYGPILYVEGKGTGVQKDKITCLLWLLTVDIPTPPKLGRRVYHTPNTPLFSFACKIFDGPS